MTSQPRPMSGPGEAGQSFAEVAIVLPIVLIILAGVVEVSNLLVTQNRVTTAARHAAGYGASHYEPSNWSSTANAMGVVARNTVTETVDLSADLWDIWSIRAKTNGTGDNFDFFEAVHVYGNHQVVPAATWTAIEPQVQADMINELQSTGTASAANLEVVASVPYHNIKTILGLNVWQWTGFKTIRGFTVMRVDRRPGSAGCPLLPITVRLNQRSAYPSNWWEDVPYLNEAPPTAEEFFPEGNKANGGFEFPNPEPVYANVAGVVTGTLRTATFRNNVPGVPLVNARPGYLYLAREQGGNGNFGWLTWDGNDSASALRNSLAYFPLPPGNFSERYPGSPADMGAIHNPPYGGTDHGDGVLQVGEWVEGTGGNIHSSVPETEFYILNGIPATLIVYDQTNGLSGSNLNYRVADFIVVKILGYSFQGNNDEKWIMFEVVRKGSECLSQ